MLKSILRRSSTAGVSYVSRRGFASGSVPERKAPILGSAGGIGQPLSLLMKLNPLVSRRSLYDIAGTSGVAADISHINTRSEVAGVPQKPGMTRDDLFNINAGIVKSLCMANALVNMISNPVNSTVPIAAELFKKAGTYDKKRLFGVTMLDVATPKANLSNEEIEALTKRTQDGGTEVAEAKSGKGSATLSMAYAGAIFADACLKGLNGVPDVVKCAFVQSNITEPPFSASKVRLEKNGTDYEKQGPEALKPELFSSIEKNTKILRPLSPHLPVYKPQLNSTFSIFHRISGAFLTTMVFFYYLLYLKIGLICFTYENFYQFFFYSSKLILLSVEITALALSYHLYTGVRHLLADFSGFFFLRMGRKRLK